MVPVSVRRLILFEPTESRRSIAGLGLHTVEQHTPPHAHFFALKIPPPRYRKGGECRKRRKKGKERVRGAKVCNLNPAIDIPDSVGVEYYQ